MTVGERAKEPTAIKPEAPRRAAAFGEKPTQNAQGVLGGLSAVFPLRGTPHGALGRFRFYRGRYLSSCGNFSSGVTFFLASLKNTNYNQKAVAAFLQ